MCMYSRLFAFSSTTRLRFALDDKNEKRKTQWNSVLLCGAKKQNVFAFRMKRRGEGKTLKVLLGGGRWPQPPDGGRCDAWGCSSATGARS